MAVSLKEMRKHRRPDDHPAIIGRMPPAVVNHGEIADFAEALIENLEQRLATRIKGTHAIEDDFSWQARSWAAQTLLFAALDGGNDAILRRVATLSLRLMPFAARCGSAVGGVDPIPTTEMIKGKAFTPATRGYLMARLREPMPAWIAASGEIDRRRELLRVEAAIEAETRQDGRLERLRAERERLLSMST